MEETSRPFCCTSICRKCGSALKFYEDGGDKTLCRCTSCPYSFRFTFELTKFQKNYIFIVNLLAFIAILGVYFLILGIICAK